MVPDACELCLNTPGNLTVYVMVQFLTGTSIRLVENISIFVSSLLILKNEMPNISNKQHRRAIGLFKCAFLTFCLFTWMSHAFRCNIYYYRNTDRPTDAELKV